MGRQACEGLERCIELGIDIVEVDVRRTADGVLVIQVEHVSLDSTALKVHPDGTGALKKTVHNLSVSHAPDGQPKFIWSLPMPKQQ